MASSANVNTRKNANTSTNTNTQKQGKSFGGCGRNRTFSVSVGFGPQKPMMLGFELESLQPTIRTVLDLDPRIFPKGILPDSIVEIRGPSGSGKTFLVTYLLARLLIAYPRKTAVLIDTNMHFNLQNLKSILAYFDQEITLQIDCDEEQKLKSQDKFLTYVNRISHIKCFHPSHLLSAFGIESPIETMLLTEPDLSLVIIDSVDCFSYISGIQSNEEFPNILKLIKTSVEKTRTPVLCTLTEFFPFPQQQPELGSKPHPEYADEFAPTQSTTATTTAVTTANTNNNSAISSSIPISSSRNNRNRKWDHLEPNIIMDPTFFTMSMILSPHPPTTPPLKIEDQQQQSASTSKIETITVSADTRIFNLNEPANALVPRPAFAPSLTSTSTTNTIFECSAHLRSRHPKTAPFSALNHRVKFSIFSGMLYTSS